MILRHASAVIRRNCILWTVEWVFARADAKYTDSGCAALRPRALCHLYAHWRTVFPVFALQAALTHHCHRAPIGSHADNLPLKELPKNFVGIRSNNVVRRHRLKDYIHAGSEECGHLQVFLKASGLPAIGPQLYALDLEKSLVRLRPMRAVWFAVVASLATSPAYHPFITTPSFFPICRPDASARTPTLDCTHRTILWLRRRLPSSPPCT